MRRSTKKIGICLVMTITMMMGLVACGKNGDSDTNPTTEIATENTTENNAAEDAGSNDAPVENGNDTSVENGNDASVENGNDTQDVTEDTKESKYSTIYEWTTPDNTIKTYAFVSLDGTTSDNVVMYNGTHKVNFTITVPYDVGAKAGERDDHIGLSNKDNTIAVKYYWDVTPTDTASVVESDDADYDKMITNNQFRYYFPNDYDENLIMQWYHDIEIVDDAKAQEIIDTIIDENSNQ